MNQRLPVDVMQASDLLMAVERSRGLSPPWLIAFRHHGPPQSKQRARVIHRYGKRAHAFTPKETVDAEQALALQWRIAVKGQTFEEPLAIGCVFFRQNHQRVDTDNLLKLVLDAGTKAHVWRDDSQVVTIVARVEYDPDHPRTEIAIAPSLSTLDRAVKARSTCEFCGKEFARASAQVRFNEKRNPSYMRFCSSGCAQAIHRRMARCAKCKTEFRRRTAAQRFCSHSCASTVVHAEQVSIGKRLGPPLCTTCGKRVSRREYLQCSKCAPKGRPTGAKNRTPIKPLTHADADQIRSLLAADVSRVEVAARFGVSLSRIAEIMHRRGKWARDA